MLPSAEKASFNVSNVVAAPQSDCRNARRPIPTRLACSPIRSSASLLARATCSVSGTGRNSPLDVESTLTGNVPLISFVILPLYRASKGKLWHLADMKTVFENVCLEHKADAGDANLNFR